MVEGKAVSSKHQCSIAMREPKNFHWGLSMKQTQKTFPNVNGTLSSMEDEEFEYFVSGFGEEHGVTSQNFGEVAILSPDPLVRTFLQGILRFQGFQSRDLSGCLDALWKDSLSAGQVVFLDSAYLENSEDDHVRQRLQEFAQNGVYFVVLADQNWNENADQFFQSGGCQVLRKPLDYRKIGQAMAQVWPR